MNMFSNNNIQNQPFTNKAETVGRVIYNKSKGLDFPTVIRVQYQVNGIIYELEDTVKYKVRVLKKLGPIPIITQNYPVMGNHTVGTQVSVTYDINNPAYAYLTHNIGWMNV